MTSASLRLSRVNPAIALALALAASPAAAAQVLTGYLKFDYIDGESKARGHEGQIEILSIQWRNAPAARGTFKGEIAAIEPAYRGSGGSKARGGTNTVDSNEKITIHGGRTEGDTDRPVIIGTLPNPPKAPMQYNPKELTVSKDNNWGTARATPAAKGSVWIRMSSPWAGCRVGKRYPSLELGEGGKTYRLQDVSVASCGRSGDADDRPTEEVAFYYNRIAFNYAN